MSRCRVPFCMPPNSGSLNIVHERGVCLGPVYRAALKVTQVKLIDTVAINIGGVRMLGFSRWQLFKGLVLAVGIVSIVSLALIYFVPATPSKVIMATGPKGSSFEYYGRQYRETFVHSNVELELRETAGAAENLEPALAEKFRSNTGDPVTALERVRSALRAPQRSAGSSFAIPGL